MDLRAEKFELMEMLINTQEKRVLDQLREVFLSSREHNVSSELSAIQKEELDNRLDNYDNEKAELLSWEEVKSGIKSN